MRGLNTLLNPPMKMIKNQPINRIRCIAVRLGKLDVLRFVPLFFDISVLRLLKDGADPHMLLSSGGSLLHLVRVIED